jgi:flagellar P-ring protein precursor FlgI
MFKRSPIALAALALAAFAACASPAQAASRVKDIVSIEGVRENQLVGYGLVVGLNGTGDSLRNSAFTKQSLEGMLERLGVNTREANLNTKNVAAVMVTASLPAFAAAGSRVDVSVSSMGDAKSLLGGSLLVTSLAGADGETYAVAQGPIVTGGFSAEGSSGSSVTKGVPTAGRIASGATVEREVAFRMRDLQQVRLTLRNPDFTTARRVADAINGRFPNTAIADNPTIVRVVPPQGSDVVGFLTAIEQLPVEVDTPAKVVIDEASGVIVMGENVRVSTVAIAQGSLTVSVQETPQVSQPEPLGEGATVVVPRSDVNVQEGGKEMRILKGGASLSSLVEGLNALGVGPRDMISILQTLKAAGALQAEIEVM